MSILGDTARVVPPAEVYIGLGGYANITDAIVGTWHPMRQDELERTPDHWSPDQVREALAHLQSTGSAQIIEFTASFYGVLHRHTILDKKKTAGKSTTFRWRHI